jgi:alanyl-tRNA synthetase
MTSSEIRNSFLKFFEEHSHTVVPSSPVVPYDDPTLLFTNAGMNQFKDVFLGTGKRTYKRAADTQKCIRVSGKHNDLEEVGRDTYHHTFFEMLGNWSFGDYYKKEAIEWAWELLTKVWGLPKNRLWVTVYKNDPEAEQLWKSVTDIDPNRILRFAEKDNFWEMGETGPCGPCSEIHIDRTPDGTATASMVNAGVADVMEIWNLVFIQYNRDAAGNLSPLPEKHVDTGMGFERLCAVLQDKNSNYETDIFTPLLRKISNHTNIPYDGRLSGIQKTQIDSDTAMRVIADHVRTLTFAIGDGAIPGNEGRGYVLRRILRRAARFGRNLGMHEPFIYKLVPALVETMSYIFPEIKTNQDHIQQVIKAEEESFNATLDRGLEQFEEIILRLDKTKSFPGEDAFKLYDTFGFPLDLTELMAAEHGLHVDGETFHRLMKEQKERSRESQKTLSVPKILKLMEDSSDLQSSKFVGYDKLRTEAHVLRFAEGFVFLDETPFYAEAGGQVGDTGNLIFQSRCIPVVDTQHLGKLIGHKIEEPLSETIGQNVIAEVNIPRRLSIQRNHSATHLLHNALRRILGSHVQQAGSLVAPEYLRFDFTHGSKLKEKELADIEALVNEKIMENIPRTPGLNNIPVEEAKKTGALMFFGEKYGDHVNVVQFGDFSTEFCGGTHVKSTGEIGYFKIFSEGSIASGVRRIEAVTDNYALEYLKSQEQNFFQHLDEAYKHLDELSKVKAELVHSTEHQSDLHHHSFGGFEQRLEDLKHITPLPDHAHIELAVCFNQLKNRNQVLDELFLSLLEEKKLFEKELARFRLKTLSSSIDDLLASSISIGTMKLLAVKIPSTTMDELKSLGDTVRAKLGSGVGLLASVIENKIQFVCVVTDDLISEKKIEAGKVVNAVAKLVGGGGGGRPHLATAGGKDIAKIDEALAQTRSVIESFLRK